MAISASDVKLLRERTGAGMMDCKKKLEEANGDFDKAVELLRKAGQAKADKKSDRIAAEGVISQLVVEIPNGQFAAILEINSETDFVARDENFKEFVEAVTKTVVHAKITELDVLNATLLFKKKNTVEEARLSLIAKIGENIQIRRLMAIESQPKSVLASYNHGGRIGVLVEILGADHVLAKDVAMHIAANKPIAIHSSEIPSALIDKERDILKGQAEESGKPANIIEKMIEGRIGKFLDENCLMGQAFVKDPSQTIAQLLKGSNAEVTRFIRFELGEGIEKKSDNFVEEVMSHVKQ